LALSLQWRHVGRVERETTSDDPTLSGNPREPGSRINAQNYFDLASTFTVGDNYNLRIGVNNLFDKEPPLVTSTGGVCPAGPCNGNTYPGPVRRPGPLLLRGHHARLLSLYRDFAGAAAMAAPFLSTTQRFGRLLSPPTAVQSEDVSDQTPPNEAVKVAGAATFIAAADPRAGDAGHCRRARHCWRRPLKRPRTISPST
jgi:hypothetical protein